MKRLVHWEWPFAAVLAVVAVVAVIILGSRAAVVAVAVACPARAVVRAQRRVRVRDRRPDWWSGRSDWRRRWWGLAHPAIVAVGAEVT